MTNGKRKNPIRNPGETLETPAVTIPDPQFRVIIEKKRVLYYGNVGENSRTRGGEETADMVADRWRIWLNLWRRCKKF